MTKLLEQAIAAVSALPEEEQDEIARIMLELASDEEYVLTPEDEAELKASIAEAERGEFATDEEIRAIWAKHRR
jgi:Spy/CpxP family protein refolding chaperone